MYTKSKLNSKAGEFWIIKVIFNQKLDTSFMNIQYFAQAFFNDTVMENKTH